MGFYKWRGPKAIKEILSQLGHEIVSMGHEKIGGTIIVDCQRGPSGDSILRAIANSHRSETLDYPYDEGLLCSIFDKDCSLHDGAIILSLFDEAGELAPVVRSARCQLPGLMASMSLPTSDNWGTRHSSAYALSKSTDALVIVVSEQTGRITFLQRGAVEKSMPQSEIERAKGLFDIDLLTFVIGRLSTVHEEVFIRYPYATQFLSYRHLPECLKMSPFRLLRTMVCSGSPLLVAILSTRQRLLMIQLVAL